jgi:TRAP-type C4-dicarboxylate transport system substrate-binding protein
VSIQGTWLQSWADRIAKDSNNRIKVRIYPSSSLLASPDTWPGVQRGVADMGFNFRYETFGVDMIVASGRALTGEHAGSVGAHTMLDAIQQFPEMAKEWSGNKVLAIFSPPPYQFNTNREVKTVDDLKGLQLRCADANFGVQLSALGGTPVVMPMDEAYQAIQKGTVQGIYSPAEVLKNFRLADVTKYTAVVNLSAGSAKGFLCLNWDSYNNLPADLRKVIDDDAAWTQDDCLRMWDSLDTDAYPYCVAQGHQFYLMPDDQMQKMNALLAPVIQGFYTKLDSMGYPGTDMYNFDKQELVKYNAIIPLESWLSQLPK